MPRTEPLSLTIPQSRRTLLRWGGWFAAANIGLMCLVGVSFLFLYPWPPQFDARLYAVTAYIGQFSLLAYVPFLLLIAPLTLLFPNKKIIFPLAVLIYSISLSLILMDSLLFSENKFHINALTITILGWKTWGFGLFFLFLILLCESMLASWIWWRFAMPQQGISGILLAIVLFSCLLGSQLQYIWADAHYYVPITKFHHYLPLYYRVTAKRLLAKYGLVDINQERERQLVNQIAEQHNSDLNYPLQTMVCEPPDKPWNILLILADALRHDVVTPEITPNIAAFGMQNIVFDQHYSGGNASPMGTFSLFYGLPSSYFESIKTQQRSSIMIDLLQDFAYQFGIFTSSSLLSSRRLDRTAFARIPNLRRETIAKDPSSYSRDKQVNQDWFGWLNNMDSDQPFFGFIFYDSTQSYLSMPEYSKPFSTENDSREQREFTAYKNSANFVDGLIGLLLEDLAQRKLLDNTVILISSNHGEEFNENGNGYWGHGTGYANYQIHTPLLIHWPGKTPEINPYRTSHYDIVPTLLSGVLNCTNPMSDYSSGKNLFERKNWPWLIVGSYDTEAILEPDQITITYPGGYFEVRDRNYNMIEQPKISSDVVSAAMKSKGRYYK